MVPPARLFLLLFLLDHSTLVLLAVDVVVLPDRNGGNSKDKEASGGSSSLLLVGAPSTVNGGANLGANGIGHLEGVTARVDVRVVGLGAGGQFIVQSFGENVGVDSTGDRIPDGTANAGKETKDGQDHGNTITISRSHDGHVLADDKCAARDGDENLAHDQVTNVLLGAAEVDHEAGSEEHERQAKEQSRVLEVTSVADPKTKDDTPEGGTHVVYLHHVASQRDGQIVDDHDEVLVVHVPAVERHVQSGGQDAGAANSTASEELVAKEVSAGKVSLPDVEDWEEANANDDHGDELGAVVLGQAIGCQAERQQEQHESRNQNDAANNVEFVCVVDDGLQHGAAARLTLPQAHALGFDGKVLEDNGERHEDEEHDDDESSVAPSPSRVVQESLGSQRSSEGSADKGRANKGKGKGPVAKARGIGHEDVHDEVQGVVANPVQNVTGSVPGWAVTLGQDNHTSQVDANEEAEGFGTTPDVEQLGDGQLDDTANDAAKNVGSGELGRGREVGVGSQIEAAAHALLEGQHKEADPDPAVGSIDCPLRPDESSRLGLLHTKSRIGGDLVGMSLDFLLGAGLQAEPRRVGVGRRRLGVVPGG